MYNAFLSQPAHWPAVLQSDRLAASQTDRLTDSLNTCPPKNQT